MKIIATACANLVAETEGESSKPPALEAAQISDTTNHCINEDNTVFEAGPLASAAAEPDLQALFDALSDWTAVLAHCEEDFREVQE